MAAAKPLTPAEIVDNMKNWSQRYKHMYNNKDYDDLCDVTFSVGGALVRGSKHVLATRSDVFKKMFYGPLRQNTDEVVQITDVEAEVFHLLLKYIYVDAAVLTGETVLGTLYVARKYRILGLETLAESFLKSNITPDNVFTIMSAASLYEKADIKMQCLKVIESSTEAVIKSTSFQKLSYEEVLLVVKLDELNIKEIVLFDGVLKWADAECKRIDLEPTADNIRKVLNEILFQIRFPAMGIEAFALGPAKHGILNDKEIASIMLNNFDKTKQIVFPTKFRSKCAVAQEKNSEAANCVEFVIDVNKIPFQTGQTKTFYSCYKNKKDDLIRLQFCMHSVPALVRMNIYWESGWRKNSWIKIINTEPDKSLKMTLNGNYMNNWNAISVRRDQLADSGNGFNINGVIRVRVYCAKLSDY